MEDVEYTRFFLSFFLVVAMIGVFGYLLRRYGNAYSLGRGPIGGRIHILEVRYIDPKHKLVLVKRDEVEHLLMVGDGLGLVIESPVKKAESMKHA
jgi:flagellar protein FliO/FliZ